MKPNLKIFGFAISVMLAVVAVGCTGEQLPFEIREPDVKPVSGSVLRIATSTPRPPDPTPLPSATAQPAPPPSPTQTAVSPTVTITATAPSIQVPRITDTPTRTSTPTRTPVPTATSRPTSTPTQVVPTAEPGYPVSNQMTLEAFSLLKSAFDSGQIVLNETSCKPVPQLQHFRADVLSESIREDVSISSISLANIKTPFILVLDVTRQPDPKGFFDSTYHIGRHTILPGLKSSGEKVALLNQCFDTRIPGTMNISSEGVDWVLYVVTVDESLNN